MDLVRLFVADMFRHWVGKMTGFLSVILGVAPIAFPEWFAGFQGLLHEKSMYWLAAVVCYLVATFIAWKEKNSELESTRNELAIAVNKDRPEVIAHYGRTRLPKISVENTDLKECVQITNRGRSDAWNVQVTPFRVGEIKVDFFDVDFLAPDATAFMVDALDGVPEGEQRCFEFVLSQGEMKQFHSETILVTTWNDSSGNRFRSRSRIWYFPNDRSSGTDVIGPIEWLGGPEPTEEST